MATAMPAATAAQQVTSRLKAAHASELSAAVRKAEAAATSKGAEALAQQKASLSQANAAELQKAVAAAKSGAGGEAQQQISAALARQKQQRGRAVGCPHQKIQIPGNYEILE